MEAPTKVTIEAKHTLNTTELISAPTKVNTHTYNSTDTDTKNNDEKEHDGERGDYDGYDTIDSPNNLGLGCVSRHVEAIISRLSRTNDKTPPYPPASEINVNGAAFQSTKKGDVICVTETITRITITRNKDLCEEGYDSDSDIGPLFDAVSDEEYIEYHTEDFIYPLVKFQGAMDLAVEATIEVSPTPVESEEPLIAEKVQKLKVAELKVE